MPIAVAYFCAHGICIYLKLPTPLKISYPFMILTPLLAAAACLWRARVPVARTRLAWSMIAASMVIWSAGMLASALDYFSTRRIGELAGFPDLLFLLYGLPILLILASPMEGTWAPLSVWMDAIQGLCAGCLVYILLFSRLPFQHQAPVPLSMVVVVLTYNVVNILLAAAAILRMPLHAKGTEERRMCRILAVSLWVYAIGAAANNYFVGKLGDRTGYLDLMADVPFLILCVSVVLLPSPPTAEARRSSESKLIARYIDNASPILFTSTLLLLAAISVRSHFHLGMLGIVLALAVYATRSTLLQNRYMRSERSLSAALAQLEDLSLRDGLTGVANRRCFDAFTRRQWSLAVDRGSSLSVLMIDLDHFKRLNDTYGHRVGDVCLVQVAAALRQTMTRSADLLARYGGEEFVAVLVDTDQQGAMAIADRMRRAVGGLDIEKETVPGCSVTVSIGISTCSFSQAARSRLC